MTMTTIGIPLRVLKTIMGSSLGQYAIVIGVAILIYLLVEGRRENENRYSPQYSDKDWTVTLLLGIFLGPLGMHRFYVHKVWTAILWMLTIGFFGIGWLIDVIFIVMGKFTDCDGCIIRAK